MTQRFEKAYNSLYNAFMNDTLAKGTCVACAVGNIVADSMGVKIENIDGSFFTSERVSFWSDIFFTSYGFQVVNQHTSEQREMLFDLTGYSVEELMKIEFAFETNTQIPFIHYEKNHREALGISDKDIIDDQFRGLMAVMDVLIELDNIEEGTKYKESFNNKFKTICQIGLRKHIMHYTTGS
jgi:hypothetical protein